MPVHPLNSAPPEHIRDRGVAWMNRGHELQQLGDPLHLAKAIDAYGEAIALLGALPPTENPGWANSLGAALMNRAQLLHRAHGTTRAAEALASFANAAAVLGALHGRDLERNNPWPRRNLAGTFVNRASLLLDLAQFSAATRDAREAIGLAVPHERVDPIDADLALKARRCLCDAIGRLIVAPGADQGALASEATDLVDDSLALIRHWTAHFPDAFTELAHRLFRYGTQLYGLHQPQFLAEFIEENLSSAHPAFRTIALEAIDDALSDRPHEMEFLTIGDPASERRLEVWRELASLRSHLVA